MILGMLLATASALPQPDELTATFPGPSCLYDDSLLSCPGPAFISGQSR